jgi:Prokaryotic E2 family E
VVPEPEVEGLQRSHSEARVLSQPDGTAIVVVPNVALPAGWNRVQTCVRWVLSQAYPAAQPDCFYTDAELRVGNGGMPTNTGMQQLGDAQLLWFSWHLRVSWRPGRDDLRTYLRFVESRFSDAR